MRPSVTWVRVPDLIWLGPPTSPAGESSLRTLWPDGIFPGFKLWTQFWIIDAGAPQGWAASNGLRITVP
jgi:hypothetical protein